MSMTGDRFFAAVLRTFGTGVVVKKPEGEAAAPQIGEFGGVSCGSDHIEGVGDVIYVALHHLDGTTLVGVLNRQALISFATEMNGHIGRISNGRRKAETRQ